MTALANEPDGTERKRPKKEPGRGFAVAHVAKCLVGDRAKQCDRDQAVNDQEDCRQNGTPVISRDLFT